MNDAIDAFQAESQFYLVEAITLAVAMDKTGGRGERLRFLAERAFDGDDERLSEALQRIV